MPRITDYSFLFQSMFGTSRMNLVNNIQLSQINSSSVQAQLKAAGIDIPLSFLIFLNCIMQAVPAFRVL